jgi:3'(2'), 5'-bisphosphate nucleotidase
MENYHPYLTLALKAAIMAGKEIKSVYTSGKFYVEQKEDNSPLTEADKRSHKKIVDILSESALPVLSEEGRTIDFNERSAWKLFWMVDPLDGTKEFIKRNGEFTVNIALIRNGEPVLGVIYAPIIDTLYFGCENAGSFKLEADEEYLSHLILSEHVTDRLMQAAFKLPIKYEHKAFTVVASRSHMSPETEAYINALRKQHGEVELISKGSSLKLCLVAEGSAQVYPRFAPTMEWDTAAGQAIVRYAGFKVINALDHQPVIYNKSELLNPWFIVQ